MLPTPVGAPKRAAAQHLDASVLSSGARPVGLALVPFLDWAVVLLSHLSGDPGQLVLNFHTGVNTLVALVFLPLLSVLAREIAERHSAR